MDDAGVCRRSIRIWAGVVLLDTGGAAPLATLARLAEVVDLIGEAIRAEDVATFLMAPHPKLRGHAPGDLRENACGFEAVKDLVLAAPSGPYR